LHFGKSFNKNGEHFILLWDRFANLLCFKHYLFKAMVAFAALLTKNQHHYIFDLWARYLWFNFLTIGLYLTKKLTQWKIRLRVFISARQVSVNCHGTIDQLGLITAVFNNSNCIEKT
jgi:hypothetical protein